MQKTSERRIGVASEISGFVVAEDQDFKTKARKRLANWRAEARAGRAILAIRFAGLVARSDRLRTAAVAGLSATVRSRSSAPRAQHSPPLLRSVQFAGVFGAYYLLRRVELEAERLFGAIRRPVLGIVALLGISAVAIAGALMVPAREPAVTSAPASAEDVTVAMAEPVALIPSSGPSVAEPPQPKPAPTWAVTRRPIALYHLEGPEVDGTAFELRVATRGPLARQDILSWTENADRKRPSARPAAQLIIERYEGEMPATRPFYPDLAARAAGESIAIDRMSTADTIGSKFGPVEIADAVLSSHRGTLGCLMFRRNDAIGLVIAGWLCGTSERPVDRVALACFLDRVDLVGAGPDGALKHYFAQAERSRKPCAGARQPGRKLSWIDHEAPLPRLKLAVRP